MRSLSQEIILPVPPERVFAAFSDLPNVSRWIPQIVRLEVQGGGPLRAGSVLLETRRFGRREATAAITIEEHQGPGGGAQLPYRHTASSTAAGVCCRYRYRVHAHPEGSRLELIMEVEAKSLFGRLAAGGMLRILQKSDSGQLLRLREYLEATPAL